MKTLIVVTTITMLGAPVFAGATENITGCATAKADNSNFTVFVDPTCYKAPETSGGANIFAGIGGLVMGSIGEEE